MVLSIQLLLLLGVPLVLTIFTTPLVLKFAGAYGLFDMPETRRIHCNPTPRLGGVAMVLGFVFTVIGTMTFIDISPGLLVLFAISIVLFFMGVWDDISPLRAMTRLAIQAGCAFLTVKFCNLGIFDIALTPESSFAVHPAIGNFLAMFVIIGSMNAINLIDGLDGLAGGVVLIAVALLTFLHVQTTGNLQVALFLSVPVIGVILGFLRYNTHPASIFMGDGGSNWLGYVVGILILIVIGKFSLGTINDGPWTLIRAGKDPYPLNLYTLADGPNRHLPFWSVIMCVAIPIVDTAIVLSSRIKKGLNPLAPDKGHFHHSLLKLGLTQSQCVGTIYFIALGAGLLGLTPVIFPRHSFSMVPYIAFIALAFAICFSKTMTKEFIKRISFFQGRLEGNTYLTRNVKTTVRILESSNRYIIYVIMLGVPIFTRRVSLDLGYAAIFSISLFAIAKFIKAKKDDVFNSIVFIIAVTILLISNNQHPISVVFSSQTVVLNSLYNLLFGWLTLTTILIFFVTFRRRYLVIRPADFLMMVIPLGLLLTPEPIRSRYYIDTVALRSLTLFFATHLLVRRQNSVATKINLVLVHSLLFIAAMGVFGLRVA